MSTSSIWNQELSSIFAPAVEPEVSEVVETTEETVITDFSPSTVTVDLADVSASDPVSSLIVDPNDVIEILF